MENATAYFAKFCSAFAKCSVLKRRLETMLFPEAILSLLVSEDSKSEAVWQIMTQLVHSVSAENYLAALYIR